MMNKKVKEFSESKKSTYSKDPNEIVSDYRKEQEAINGYNGRQILELLQNAVDEMRDIKDDANKKVEIRFDEENKTLIISNNGKTFTEAGIRSIIYSNFSPKFENFNYIGNKGTGFRSILSWAKKVSIYSGALSVSFSKEHAKKTLNGLLKHEKVRVFFENENIERKMAIFTAPEIIENMQKDFDTVIKIEIEETVISEIRNQINRIEPELLLFLENLKELCIIDSKGKKEFKRAQENVGNVGITTFNNGIEISNESYSIYDYTGYLEDGEGEDLKDKNKKILKYFIQIAYKENGRLDPSNLYSYFKTDIYFPLPIIVNASFDLTSDRNHIVENKTNKLILEKIRDHIFEIAEKRALEGISDYSILKTLLPNNNFESLAKFEFYESYIERLIDAKIYPTIDGKYKKLKEVVLFKSELSRFLDEDKKKNVLSYTNDKDIIDFISNKGTGNSYSYKEILESLKDDISDSDKCKCLFSIYKEYRNNLDKNALKILNKNYESKDVFLQATQHEVSEPPQWANIIFLNDKYKKELIELFKESENRNLENNNRALTDELKNIIKEYNFETIAKSLCESCKNDIKKNKEFILWLYKNKRDENCNSIRNLGIELLSKAETLCPAKELYLNEEIEKLCPEDTASRFIDINFYKHDRIDDFEDLKRFFTNIIGVKSQLNEEVIEVIEDIKKITEWFLSSKQLTFPIKVNNRRTDDKYSSIIEFETSAKARIELEKTDLLREILENENNSTKKILDFLSNINCKSWEKSDYWVECKRKGSNQNYFKQSPWLKLLNYNLFQIKTTKWVEIDGTKYAPEELVISLNYAYESENITLKYLDLENFRGNGSLKDLKNLFLKFGVNDDFSTVPIEKLYGILNDINEKKSVSENEKKLIKRIYNELINHENIFFKNNYYINPYNFYEFKKFSENGKVLCKSGELVAVQDVFYEDNPSNRKDINFIDITHRRNSEYIKNRLCVERFKEIPKIHNCSKSKFHDKLSRDFDDFKIYAYAYRMRQNKTDEELANWKNLTIEFCDTLSISYADGKDFDLKDYQFVCGKDKSFFKISSDEKTIEFASAISDVILLNLKITNEELKNKCRLLYSCSKQGREYLANQDDIDMEDVRSRWGLQSSREESFSKTCNELKLNLSTNIFKIDEISKIENLGILRKELINAKKDIDDFNQIYEYEKISLIDYYLSELDKLRQKYRDCYADLLYQKYKNSSEEEQNNYYKKLAEYDSCNYEVINSVKFNPELYLKEKWGITENYTSCERTENWKKNKQNFKEGKDEYVLEEFYNKYPSDKLHLEFGVEIAQKHWDDFVKEQEIEKQKTIEKISDNKSDEKAKFIRIEHGTPLPSEDTKSNDEKSSNAKNSRGGDRDLTSTKRSRIGKEAELYAYNQLKNQYGETKVKWVSKYAKDENFNPDGKDGLGYDLWYDNNGEIKYVEVKAYNNIIHISSNEYKCAKKYEGFYEVWLVNPNKNEIYTISNITEYSLIPESYIIQINTNEIKKQETR